MRLYYVDEKRNSVKSDSGIIYRHLDRVKILGDNKSEEAIIFFGTHECAPHKSMIFIFQHSRRGSGPAECKEGQRIKLYGDKFIGSWAYDPDDDNCSVGCHFVLDEVLMSDENRAISLIPPKKMLKLSYDF